uniref:Riboflavin transporter n=1 Tax=Panagrellus redivivus TaxID=6233 RepID=A0A7E4WE87_PANRE
MVNLITYVLVAIFGSSSWLSTNSVWMQLSLMVDTLPEGWSLPSYLSVAVQIACIGPLIYSILHKCTNFDIPKAPVIQALLILCTVFTLLMAFFWDYTQTVFGKERSTALIVIMFVMALVNATSNVLFLPYMATFHPTYLTAYFVGMGLSALIPSLFSLIQGTSNFDCVFNATSGIVEAQFHPARFGVRDFNLIMFVWMGIATASFALLHWGHECWTQPPTPPESVKGTKSEDVERELDELQPLNQSAKYSGNGNQPTQSEDEDPRHSFQRYCILLGCLAFICAQMNGVVPSIQSFSALAYTPLTYHLALALGNLAQALACFLPLWFQPRSVSILVILTGIATTFCGYIVLIASQSPTPWLVHSNWGGILSVTAAVLAAGFHAYLRTVFTSVIREDNPHSESRLFWCGVYMQVGSFIGTTVMFPLVNYAQIFQSAVPCANY